MAELALSLPAPRTGPETQPTQETRRVNPETATALQMRQNIKSRMTMAHCKFLFMLDTCMSQRQQQKRKKALWNI